MAYDKVWKIRSLDPKALALAHDLGIQAIHAQLLINRGIHDDRSARSFFNPRLSDLTDPMLLKDMDRAVESILQAVENQDRIIIYGDYDADGVTSTALLLNFFSDLHVPASFYIPNRIREGYGLNRAAVEKISGGGRCLMITVDCGISNRPEIEYALQRGMEVVVTDHHQIPEHFEPVCPVINPHRQGSLFPFRGLSGVAVSFFLSVALRAALRKRGWFKRRLEPDLRHYLDLVALGTVGDMVSLLEQNRILVAWGMETMKHTQHPGIRAIGATAGVTLPHISLQDLAFKLVPRINAPGRMGYSESGVHLLTARDSQRARLLAEQVNTLNDRRQMVEQDVLHEMEKILEEMDVKSRRTMVFSGKGWHRGVLGIVASRLAERYFRPALVLNINGDMATGSGRSIHGFNLYEALARSGIPFEKFGGHDRAVGFALKARHIHSLAENLEALSAETLPQEALIPGLEVDGEVTLPELDCDTVRQIEQLSPFGPGNPEPLFYTHSLQVIHSRVVGGSHLKLRVKQGSKIHDAIGFGLSDQRPQDGAIIHMVYRPEINLWQGYERIQLRIMDLETMSPSSKKCIIRI